MINQDGEEKGSVEDIYAQVERLRRTGELMKPWNDRATMMPDTQEGVYQQQVFCRGCGSTALHLVMDLGDTPLFGVKPAPAAPLALLRCERCTLGQLSVTISGDFFPTSPDGVQARAFASMEEPVLFLAQTATVLKTDHVLNIEALYLPQVVGQMDMGAIAHHILCYYTAAALVTVLENAGLYAIDADVGGHFGNILHLRASNLWQPKSHRLERILEAEKAQEWHTENPWMEFWHAAQKCWDGLLQALSEAPKPVYLMGADRGNYYWLRYLGCPDAISGVACRNTTEQGLDMAGLPLVSARDVRGLAGTLLYLPPLIEKDILELEKPWARAGGVLCLGGPNPQLCHHNRS